MPKNPTTAQVTEAFRDSDDILVTCFAVDAEGEIFHVKKINQLTHGQPIWRETEVMLFPNFLYSNRSTIEQFLNPFTRRKRKIFFERVLPNRTLIL